jgi:hypothetical protein
MSGVGTIAEGIVKLPLESPIPWPVAGRVPGRVNDRADLRRVERLSLLSQATSRISTFMVMLCSTVPLATIRSAGGTEGTTEPYKGPRPGDQERLPGEDRMELTIQVDDLTAEQQADVIAKLGCTEDELPDRLARVGVAAYSDYMEMIQGVPLPGRAEEVKEKRLLHLLKRYATPSVLLTEYEIAAMFQMNHLEAGRLLRNVRARYHAELDSRVKAAARKILESANQVEGNFRVQVTSSNLLDALQFMVTSRAPNLDQIGKVRGSAALYDIPPDTYTKLCEAYGATAVGSK